MIDGGELSLLMMSLHKGEAGRCDVFDRCTGEQLAAWLGSD
jgi:hypothetical protein